MPTINPTNLKHLREKKGLTLSKLAEASKVERSTINRIERGKQSDNRHTTVQRLAEALDVEVKTLTGPAIGQPVKEAEIAKSQMNFRVSNGVRNALTLVAWRYGVKPVHVLQAAPLLFLWAAEESLKRRQHSLEHVETAWEAIKDVRGFSHLTGDLTTNSGFDHIAYEERKSLTKRDIFGLLINENARPPAEEGNESEPNPMTDFIADLVEPLGDLADFHYWSPHWGPQFSMCRDEASLIVDGDPDAVEAIVGGAAALHELPKEVREGGPEQIAVWAKDRGKEARQRSDELLRKLKLRGINI